MADSKDRGGNHHAPAAWNDYETQAGALPGQGQATFRIRVSGVKAGREYGIRIQNMASAYRLYIDDTLVAQNGAFEDRANAPASDYKPQRASFFPASDSFDMILQISNDAYAVGGMWEPVIFGLARQVTVFDRELSGIGIASYASIIVLCTLFLVFYAARRQERELYKRLCRF